MVLTVTARALLAALLLGAMGAGATDRGVFEAAYRGAEQAHRAALASGSAWLDTAGLLREARVLSERGAYAAALHRVEQARFQGQAALAQAHEQDRSWAALVPGAAVGEGRRHGGDRPATPWGEASAETFAGAYQAARTAQARVAVLDNEWRDIAPLLRDADALAQQGQYDEATALAEQALFQARRAGAQAVEQGARWRSFVVQ